MGEHRSTTELREYLKTVAKENDTMTRSNRDRRGARKVRTQSAEPAYTGIINVYKLVNRDETVEREREQMRVFIPTHITPEQDRILKNDQKLLGIYQQLIFHGRSIPTSDIRISESEAECQQIIHEYITDSTNPKNILFKFRNKSNNGWYEHKLSACQMLQLIKLFPGIAHGSYDVQNIRPSYSRSQNGVYAFYIKKEVADLLKKIGMKIPEVKPVKKTTGMIRGRTRRRDGDYALTPEEIADAEQLTGDQMAKLNLNDPKQAAMMDVALHKREREIIEERKRGMSDDERAAYEEEEKREAKREANRGKKRRSNLTRYAKGIQKVNSFRGTIREFIVPEDELSDTPAYLRNKKIINIYCNEKGIMNYEPKPGDLINDVTKGPIVTPSKEDVNNGYVTPLHASWYRDGNLQEGYSETINSASFDDEDEPAKTSTPKRKRKKAEAPAAKRGTAKKSISTVKPTARRSQ